MTQRRKVDEREQVFMRATSCRNCVLCAMKDTRNWWQRLISSIPNMVPVCKAENRPTSTLPSDGIPTWCPIPQSDSEFIRHRVLFEAVLTELRRGGSSVPTAELSRWIVDMAERYTGPLPEVSPGEILR